MIKFIINKPEASNKAKSKKENKSRVPGIERFIPGNDAKFIAVLIHTWVIVEETFNPLDEAKAKYKKNLVKAKRIIADSIKDHLIPHVSSFKIPKHMLDALSRLYEGKNINRKMTLRTQLKNVKMQNSETIQSYFTRVSQIKEQLEAIGDTIEEAKLVMTTLNGLPKSWESFI
jgi:hypothetical protein